MYKCRGLTSFVFLCLACYPLSIFSQIANTPGIITGVADICQGDTVQWSVSSTHRSVRWSNGDTSRSIKVATSSPVTVDITTASGEAQRETRTLTVKPRPSVRITGVPFVCYGRATELIADGDFQGISWSNGAVTRVTQAAAVGTYTATVTATNGCVSISRVEVRDGSKPFNALKDTVKICEGDSALLDASTPFARSYYWAIETEDTTSSVVARDSGVYSVIVSSGECVSYDTVFVLTLPRPVVSLGVDTSICLNDTIVLRTETNPLYTYLWSNGSTKSEIRVSDSASYSLQVSFGACQESDTILIDIFNKQRSRQVLDTVLCTPQYNIVPMQLGAREYRYGTRTLTSFPVNASGVYNILAYNKKCFVELRYKLDFKSVPDINLPNDTIMCREAGEKALFLSAGKMNAARYRWQNDDTMPTFNVTRSGQYAVFASNECGETSDSINVTVKDCNAIFLPNIFSPNGDGLNETFKISPSSDVAQIKRFSIFDRWGGQVFTASNFSVDEVESNAWDGNFNGKAAASGDIFIYFVEYVTVKGVEIMRKGDVTVLR